MPLHIPRHAVPLLALLPVLVILFHPDSAVKRGRPRRAHLPLHLPDTTRQSAEDCLRDCTQVFSESFHQTPEEVEALCADQCRFENLEPLQPTPAPQSYPHSNGPVSNTHVDPSCVAHCNDTCAGVQPYLSEGCFATCLPNCVTPSGECQQYCARDCGSFGTQDFTPCLEQCAMECPPQKGPISPEEPGSCQDICLTECLADPSMTPMLCRARCADVCGEPPRGCQQQCESDCLSQLYPPAPQECRLGCQRDCGGEPSFGPIPTSAPVYPTPSPSPQAPSPSPSPVPSHSSSPLPSRSSSPVPSKASQAPSPMLTSPACARAGAAEFASCTRVGDAGLRAMCNAAFGAACGDEATSAGRLCEVGCGNKCDMVGGQDSQESCMDECGNGCSKGMTEMIDVDNKCHKENGAYRACALVAELYCGSVCNAAFTRACAPHPVDQRFFCSIGCMGACEKSAVADGADFDGCFDACSMKCWFG